MGARIKNRSSLFFLTRQHLCASLALICFMIDIKDQHIYLWRQKSCSLLEASVLPWRSSGTVRLLCEEMVDGSGHPFLEFRHICIIHIDISILY